MSETILVIEDEDALREGLGLNLRLAGYEVRLAPDGMTGLGLVVELSPALLVLDMMLPDLDGLEIIDTLRGQGDDVPILVLSARSTTEDKIEGLKLGADDYLSKPFELSELLARVEAMLRRRRARVRERLCFGEICIDMEAREVTRADEVVALSAKEFNLLYLLARSPGRTFSRELILDRVWGWGFEGTSRTVNNFILSLRHKLEDNPKRPRHIKTVRQVGYKLVR
ncbi:response regulator transcription factor [Myxococcota bacterium]|nr:response regulator transcription factor [Myxococcota bacterium]MBU1431428.1 response regulator transcription factor [Myxococcota bacterium]MBU1898876.1 response regulator transcription factor [Myxococcota bacterium]